jgi:hypothetical protein
VTKNSAANSYALNLRNAAAKLAWAMVGAVGTVIATAILTFAGNSFTNGGIVRLLGGISASQIADALPVKAHAFCPDVGVSPIKGTPDKTFCFLTDVSVRQGNSIMTDTKGGWSACKIEPDNSGKSQQLVAQMDGQCSPSKGPEIFCQATCISY